MRIFFALLLSLMTALPALGASITDTAGRVIPCDKPYTRIISLYAAHTENLFELGLAAEIVGVSRNEDFPAAALEKPTFNARDGVERFLAAHPDLVLIRPMHWRAYPELWKALDRAGVRVAVLQPSSVKDMYEYWKALGQLTGRQGPARNMTERFKAGLTRQRHKLAAIPENKRPKVFFESIHRKLSTFSPNSMAMFALENAGGTNAAPNAAPRHGTNIAAYGKERLLARADTIDVYLAQTGTMNRVSGKDIVREPGFAALRAVQNGRIYLVDESLVSRPTLRLLAGIERLHKLLYPGNRN